MSRRVEGMGVGVWVLAIGLVDFSLEQAIVVPALPAIETRYGASPTAAIWILTGFLLALAVATPLAGRLGDRHGKRLVLMASLALFVAGSVLSALAGSIGVVIAGRIVQGLGAGVGPLAVGLVRDHLPPERVAPAIGVLVGLAGAGGVVGFLACGLLVKYVSVPAIFWLLAVAGVGCMAAVRLTVAESPIRARTTVDWLGAALLGAAFAALLLAISEGNTWHWGSTREVGIFAGAAALLAAFLARELTATEPLIDPSALRGRAIVSANVAVFGVGFALLAGYAIVPLFASLPAATGYGLGLSTIQLSLALAPSAVGAVAGGLVSGSLVGRSGTRYGAIAGAAAGLAAYALFVPVARTTLAVILLMIPLGFGTGLAIAAITDLVALSARSDETGVTVGLNSIVRAVGSALGAQVAVAIWTGAPALAPGLPAESGITNAFVVALIATVVAAGALALIPHRAADPALRLRPQRSPTPP